jgi:hypothetical protein
MGPLCITDPKYGPHSQEIRSFGKFLRKMAISVKTVG